MAHNPDNDTSDTTPWDTFGLNEWVAIDLETTGLDSSTDSIIELGAVRFRNGRAIERFERFVKPHVKRLPLEITELTGITDGDLADAPPLGEVAREFIDFVGASHFVGQNVAFDIGFLTASPILKPHFSPAKVIPRTHDTSLIARFLMPCIDAYGLASLTRRYKIPVRPNHRAACDAEATGILFGMQLEKLWTVPLQQISTALNFVEGTSSPLVNTLRAVRSFLLTGASSDKVPPDPLKGLSQGKSNIYSCTGDPPPDEPATDQQIQRFMNDLERFRAVMPSYESRPQQTVMATLTSQAFRDGNVLLVEAGTGVGKSLGYLIPALLSGGRVVISTHTKNLQDQLFFNDIPILGDLFKFGFKAALLKGRRNYLCRTKWKNLTIDPDRIAAPRLREQAALIVRWVAATKTGDVSEINAVRGADKGGFFNLIVSEPGYCGGRSCDGPQECPLTFIRRWAQKARLLVVNHSLVMADMLAGGGLLGEVDKIVFDEAHHIEEVATDQFGTEIFAPFMMRTLDRVARFCKRGGELWVRIAAESELQSLVGKVEKASSDSTQISSTVNQFFSQVRESIRDRLPKSFQYSISFRYRNGDNIHSSFIDSGDALSSGLKGVGLGLVQIRERLEDLDPEEFPASLMQEFQAILEEVSVTSANLTISLTADDENRVYWVEVSPDLNSSDRLMSAPLDVSETLHDRLWCNLKAAVLTSATLTTKNGTGGFDHLAKRLGVSVVTPERYRCETLGSPFDFSTNCQVYYPPHLPSPTDQSGEHNHATAGLIGRLAVEFKRNILVLFTSYKAMWQVYSELKRILAGTDTEILVQQVRGHRARLVNRFRKTSGAILLGTNSLWEGIDIPGEGLQIVVIPKLPFQVPTNPIVAARIDQIRDAGGNAFGNYQLPNAVLKLRQGAGRLIRSTTDRGVVIVLDSRVVKKSYGRDFRAGVQGKPVIPDSEDDMMRRIEEFFKND